MTFTASVKSIQFLLNHSVDLKAIMAKPAFSDVNDELIRDILTGAADFAENVWALTNWDGDQNPAQLDGDNVTSCLLYTSPSPRDATLSRMPSSA